MSTDEPDAGDTGTSDTATPGTPDADTPDTDTAESAGSPAAASRRSPALIATIARACAGRTTLIATHSERLAAIADRTVRLGDLA